MSSPTHGWLQQAIHSLGRSMRSPTHGRLQQAKTRAETHPKETFLPTVKCFAKVIQGSFGTE